MAQKYFQSDPTIFKYPACNGCGVKYQLRDENRAVQNFGPAQYGI
jgi:hypothetical protein